MLPSYIRKTLCRPGTPLVRIVYGEFHSYVKKTLNEQLINPKYSRCRSLRDLQLQKKSVVALRDSAPRIDIQVYLDSATVRALYEGLLVILWTTAQKRPQQRWSCLAQLAFFLVFFATLTVVGRCYASTNDVAAPLNQFHPRLQNNSIHPTSNLILGRLLIPNRFVKSDTRIIREENHPKVLFNRTLRIKREFDKTAQANRKAALKAFNKIATAVRNLRSNDGLGLVSALENISDSKSAGIISTRVTVNVSVGEDRQLYDSHFLESGTGDELLKTTQRPMPPEHAHDNESGKIFV